jgi:hypothetical protein
VFIQAAMLADSSLLKYRTSSTVTRPVPSRRDGPRCREVPVLARDPAFVVVATCVPSLNSFSVVPSKVRATCAHVPAVSAVPLAAIQAAADARVALQDVGWC